MTFEAFSSLNYGSNVLHDLYARKYMVPCILKAEWTKFFLASDKVQGSYPLGDIKGFKMIVLIGAHVDRRYETDGRDYGVGTLTRRRAYMVKQDVESRKMSRGSHRRRCLMFS